MRFSLFIATAVCSIGTAGADAASQTKDHVLEIPTPRHHLAEVLALGLDPAAPVLAPVIQERAYSSPAWYRP